MDTNTRNLLIAAAVVIALCIISLLCSSCFGVFSPKPAPPAKFCTPASSRECTCGDGSKGTQVCNVDGTAYGNCQNCKPIPICTPGVERSCLTKCPDGSFQTQVCNVDGASYSVCSCKGTLCIPGQQKACTCSDGTSGVQICNSAGSAYDACKCLPVPPPPTKCTAGQTRDCACPNGVTGKQTCKSDGSDYGPCDCPAPAPTTVTKLYGIGTTSGDLYSRVDPNADWTIVQSYRAGDPHINSINKIGNTYVGTFSLATNIPANADNAYEQTNYVYTKGTIGGAWNGPKKILNNPKSFFAGPDGDIYSIDQDDGCLYSSKCLSGPWVMVPGMCDMYDIIANPSGNGFIGVKKDGLVYTKASKNASDSWVKTSDDCCVTQIAYGNGLYFGLGSAPKFGGAIYTKKSLTDKWSDSPLNNSKGIRYITTITEPV